MATNKRKVLDAARKYAQKGAKEKALREYHALLKLDPRDAKLHLEIGDCYRRWGQIDEAITQYARVADQYKADGFDARAVAVFKQILNLDPKRYASYVSLAELYQRMGLDSEALSALQTAADGYHKEGQKKEALDLLRRMATLDPTNTTSRLKVAELLRHEGREDDAVAEYESVVEELSRQGALESVISVQERILDLRPDRPDLLIGLSRGLIELKKPERAEPFAKRALDASPDDTDCYELLLDIYKALGRDDELAQVTRRLAGLYRDRGDDDRARELTQRIPLAMELDGGLERGLGDESPGVGEDASELLSDDDLLDDDFLASDSSETRDALTLEGGADEIELELAEETPGPASDDAPELEVDEEEMLDGGGDEAGEMPAGDPDQLLAEASVYLRYGKGEQAIASLEAVLAQEPDHRAALEKLGEAHADAGEVAAAVEHWSRAATRARADGDGSGFEILRDRIAALDPEAAGQLAVDDEEPELELALGEEAEAALSLDDAGPEPDAADEGDLEIDVSVGDDDGLELAAESDEPGLDTEPGDSDADLEIEVAAEEEDAEIDIAVEEDGEAIEDDDFEIEVDAEDEASGEPAAAASGRDTSASQQVAEDLEEAEFYFDQKLYDEAEGIYRRILEIAPNHPSAMLRLGELAAARGDDPVVGVEAPADEGATQVADEVGLADRAPDDVEVVEEEPAVADIGDPADAGDTSVFDPADLASRDADEAAASDPEVDDSTQFVQPAVDPGDVEEATQPLAAAAGEGGGGDFDLAAELREMLEGDDGVSEEPADGAAPSTAEDGFASIFSDFKQGVSATLSEDDYETRYDLGIAYREMDLYDDALGEFRLCLESPGRRVDSLHMMGLCALDLGRFQDAANHLEQALSLPDLPDVQLPGLRFAEAQAFEGMGDVARARAAYECVLEADPGFPGARERLDGLGASDGEGGFESFDDIVAEAEGAPAAASESFESFDDVISSAEIEHAAEPATAEPEPAAEPEPKEEAEPKPKKRRKKKISFV